jgi:hypothetical protein
MPALSLCQEVCQSCLQNLVAVARRARARANIGWQHVGWHHPLHPEHSTRPGQDQDNGQEATNKQKYSSSHVCIAPAGLPGSDHGKSLTKVNLSLKKRPFCRLIAIFRPENRD